MRPVTQENDVEKQTVLFIKFNEEMIQPRAKKIEQFLINNGTGFLVGDAALTIYFNIVVEFINHWEKFIRIDNMGWYSSLRFLYYLDDGAFGQACAGWLSQLEEIDPTRRWYPVN